MQLQVGFPFFWTRSSVTWFLYNIKNQNQTNKNDKKTQYIYLLQDSAILSSLSSLDEGLLNLPVLSHYSQCS